MEYRTVASKLPRDEFIQVKTYCDKKNITMSSLIRKVLRDEISVNLPNYIAGTNNIQYNVKKDVFDWTISLDIGVDFNIMNNITPNFVSDLLENLDNAQKSRFDYLNKSSEVSVAIQKKILKGINIDN